MSRPQEAETERFRPGGQDRPWPPPAPRRRKLRWQNVAGWLFVAIIAVILLVVIRGALFFWHVGGPLTGHG